MCEERRARLCTLTNRSDDVHNLLLAQRTNRPSVLWCTHDDIEAHLRLQGTTVFCISYALRKLIVNLVVLVDAGTISLCAE